jgi:hypothetical protein
MRRRIEMRTAPEQPRLSVGAIKWGIPKGYAKGMWAEVFNLWLLLFNLWLLSSGKDAVNKV